MRLRWIELRDFRNHEHTQLELVPDGLTVAVGPNGEGKTNLLEGMAFLYALGSPRTSLNAPLVREGADAAFVRGEFETLGGKVLVEIEIPRRGASRMKVNRSPVRRRRDLRRQIRVILFGPFDLRIVSGDPSKRRDFVDEMVVALHPARDTLSTAYERVLRQRNRLLKESEGRGVPAGLDAWDQQLVDTGAAVIRARAKAIDRVGAPASEEFEHVAGYGLHVAYAPNVPVDGDVEDVFHARLQERRADELQRRTSLVGPHRDDLALAVRDLGARAFGSHGETSAAALCLRLALSTAVAAELGEPPVLLVDDPFSALDPDRRDRVGARLTAREGQVVISVADEAAIPRGAAAVWDIRAGTVQERRAA
jgi:DNA replication and repair protein RecF